MAHLRHLIPYMARYRLMFLIGLFCAAIGAGVSAASPYVLRLAVDAINAGNIDPQVLLQFGGWLVLIAIIDGGFKFGQRMLIAGASYRVEYDLRTHLFDRYTRLDQSFYGRNYTGDLMARATNDLTVVRQFLGPGISGSATAILLLVASAILMFTINTTLAGIVLLLLPITTVVFVIVGSRMRQVFTQVQDQFGVISSRVQENISGIRTIKAYAQEEPEIAVFETDNEHYRELNLRYVLLSGALWPAMTLILGLVGAVVLLVGGQLVTAGTITIGELVQFNAYLVLLAFPMIMMGWMVSLYQQASASMGRLMNILRQEEQITNPVQVQPFVNPHGTVEFRGVGIRFHEELVQNDQTILAPPHTHDGWLLHDINFTVPAGSSLAIVGATGSGKTSLINLLGRVRDPDAGQVLIDGMDIRSLDLHDLRRTIAYVPQESFLFSVSLRENVLFGIEEIDGSNVDERMETVVTASRLSNDLNQFPDGIDTAIGERGVTLSGGQKQRVAIARAIMRDPRILILDDALSSVDTHTAAQILEALREIMQQRTSIIIAQRIASVKAADQIIVLDDGHIVERGTHHDLLGLEGRYAAMYRRELLEQELSD
jgi:ATP-binding cassette subfamily B multidrug efflux pump